MRARARVHVRACMCVRARTCVPGACTCVCARACARARTTARKRLGERLARVPGLTIDRGKLQTNMVFADTHGVGLPAARVVELLDARGVLALDEAHKVMDGAASDGLSEAIVNVARLMRHDGMRLAVSTQSPAALAPELLELVTVAVLHRFHSRDWFAYLAKKLPLPARAREQLMELRPGHALVFASQHRVARAAAAAGRASGDADGGGCGHVFQLHIRQRITADRGATRINA